MIIVGGDFTGIGGGTGTTACNYLAAVDSNAPRLPITPIRNSSWMGAWSG
jgi:hypothetical protein